MNQLARPVVSFTAAAIITGALFFAMQQMLSQSSTPEFAASETVAIQFNRYKPREELPEQKKQELPEPPKEQLPPETPKPDIATPEAPKITAPELSRLNIKTPLRMSGTPFLGVSAPSTELGEAIPLVRIPPRYPLRAKRQGLSGRVLVEFVINEQGLVESPIVVEADPPDIFDNAAMQAILRWKFKPRIENGVALKRNARQEFIFEPPK